MAATDLSSSRFQVGATFPARRLTDALKAASPPLLFGLRLWASVSLALYVAFWLELDNPVWAGTSAAIVCQPHLGASLRKGWYRMIGTLVGAVAIVALTACFPQDRALFLGSVALWGVRVRSPRRCCATSPPIRRHWPATRRRSSPATCSAPPAGSMRMPLSCSPSVGAARSLSASFAPASFSPPPISATLHGAWLRCSRPLRPRLRTDLPKR
jgi:hypothetical protein